MTAATGVEKSSARLRERARSATGASTQPRATSAVRQARCWPPSTQITCPVRPGMSRMKASAAAISSGSTPRPRMVAARCAAKCASDWRAPRSVGPGRDPHHPDVRREALRGGAGQRPQPHLGNRIGCKLRGELADALVEHVDDDGPGDGLAGGVAPGAAAPAPRRPGSARTARAGSSRCAGPSSPRWRVRMVSCSKIEALLTSTVSGRPSAAAAAGTSAAVASRSSRSASTTGDRHAGRARPPRRARRRRRGWRGSGSPRRRRARRAGAPSPRRAAARRR